MRPLAPSLVAALLLGGGIAGVAHAADDGPRGAIVRPAVGGTVLAVIGQIEVGGYPTGVAVTRDDTVLASVLTAPPDDTVTESAVATIPPGQTSGLAPSIQRMDVGDVWQVVGIETGTTVSGDDTATLLGSVCAPLATSCDDSVVVAYWGTTDDTLVFGGTRLLPDLGRVYDFAVTDDGKTVVAGVDFTVDDDSMIVVPYGQSVQYVPLGVSATSNLASAVAITADDTVWFASHFGVSTTDANEIGFFSLDDTATVTVLPTVCHVKSPVMAIASNRISYLQSCPYPNTVPIGLGLRNSVTGSLDDTWPLSADFVSDLSPGNSHLLAGLAYDRGATVAAEFSVMDVLTQTVAASVSLPYFVVDSLQAPISGLIYVAQGPSAADLTTTAHSLAVIDNVAVGGLSVSGGSAGTSTSFDVTATSGATWDDSTIESVTFGGASASHSRAGNTVTASAPAGSGSVSVVVTFNGGNSLNVGTFTYPPPPPVYPPSAPRDVTAIPGDKAVTVSWSASASSGSFAISNYQVRSTPASDGCMTAELSCEIGNLVNGTAYTFEVRALNGAGWGPWSVASEPVTPGPAASIVITGTRGTVNGKPGVIVEGTTTGLVGAEVTPWVRFPGQSSYAEGTGTRTVDAEGRFTWKRKTGKRIYVYFRSGDAKSNRLIIER